MNYYLFHIGDYASHTRGLSLMEDLAYRRLLDLYYLTEHPINDRSTTVQRPFNDRSTDVQRPLNECATRIAKLIGMADQVDAVEYILCNFFVQNEQNQFINARADREIESFLNKKTQASVAGKRSAQARKTGVEADKMNGRSTDVQRPFNDRSTNQEPITNNQEPIEYISYPTDTRSFFNEQEAPGGEIVESAPVSKALIESPKVESKAVKRAKFEREQAELFEKWWKAYPRKQAKKTAFNAWLKIQPSPTMDDVSKLVQIVSVQARTAQWTKDNGEFIPMPATYINQARWTDQVTEISNEPNYGSADW